MAYRSRYLFNLFLEEANWLRFRTVLGLRSHWHKRLGDALASDAWHRETSTPLSVLPRFPVNSRSWRATSGSGSNGSPVKTSVEFSTMFLPVWFVERWVFHFDGEWRLNRDPRRRPWRTRCFWYLASRASRSLARSPALDTTGHYSCRWVLSGQNLHSGDFCNPVL